jgi:thioredoxin reductase (NADPH)
VFYLVRDRSFFRDKKIVIAGGGDSAVDWTLSLCEIAQHVTLVHRRDKFKAHASSLDALKNLESLGKITLKTPYQLHKIRGDLEAKQITHVECAHMDGNIEAIEADVLLPFYGLAANLGPINSWGLQIDRHTIPVDPSNCATSVPGIFAIGDIAHYQGKLKLILCGFSEGALAAHGARSYIHPGEVFHFEHSTTTGVPKS